MASPKDWVPPILAVGATLALVAAVIGVGWIYQASQPDVQAEIFRFLKESVWPALIGIVGGGLAGWWQGARSARNEMERRHRAGGG